MKLVSGECPPEGEFFLVVKGVVVSGECHPEGEFF